MMAIGEAARVGKAARIIGEKVQRPQAARSIRFAKDRPKRRSA